MVDSRLEGDPKYYRHIVAVLGGAFLFSSTVLLILNSVGGAQWLEERLGEVKAFFFQLYFWGTMGATVASYKFFADDKELNEVECLKETPDPTVLRFPNGLDVCLYALRILLSGVLALIAASIFLAGLGYFDAKPDTWSSKQYLFFVILAFLVGVYQNDFLSFLASLKVRFLRQQGSEDQRTKPSA